MEYECLCVREHVLFVRALLAKPIYLGQSNEYDALFRTLY